MERTTADRVRDPIIGRVLDGRYRILARVARGGMATVYEGVDTRLDRTVAVKVMHQGLSSGDGADTGDEEAFSRRFRREAQSAARLAHQNAVAVFDQGDDAGTLFLVMEYVPGITLRDLIRAEAPIAPVKALLVIEPVLAALAAAHKAGMIHRDVKPENVLLGDDGQVKVADFGLARAVNAETQHTSTGVLIGTVSYLSPELVVAGTADARADVYAVGVMIYEMLTGVKPHQAESPIQVAYKHVHEDIPAPSARVPGLPAYVDALVARATARDTALRPTDAGVLLHQVRRVHSALDAGVVDDPDLVADLLPRRAPDPFVDTDGQMPRAIIDPSQDTGAWSPVPDDDNDDEYAPYTSGTAGADEVYDQENEATSSVAYSAPQVIPPPAPSPTDPAMAAGPPPPRRPAPAQQRRPPRRGPAALVLLLVLALAIGIGAWYFGVARYTTTPGVINQSRTQAQAKIAHAGLKFDVQGQAYSNGIPAGSVMATSPEPGAKILKHGTVEVTLSRGPEVHSVPDVHGKSLDQAQALLQDAKLGYGKAVKRYNERIPVGTVIGTTPKAGTELRRDSAVDVIVSRGKRPIQVPDFTGKSADEARKALEKLAFVVTSTKSYDDTVAKGHVVTQTPRGGTLHKGDGVALVISRGPQLVAVPHVVGVGVDQATTLLQDQGFKVKTTQSNTYIGLGYVLSSDPAQGEKVPKGSVITLSLV